MVLEIINSSLTHQLAQNPNLIYTLLYKRDVFHPYRMHSAFQDIIQNIYSVSEQYIGKLWHRNFLHYNIWFIFQVINFFSYKLEQMGQSQIGVSQVLAAIQQGSTQWPKDRLRVDQKIYHRYHCQIFWASRLIISLGIFFSEISRTQVQVRGGGSTRRIFYTVCMECCLPRCITTLGRWKYKTIAT